ncbi:MAG: hypothetical protein VKM97_01260 [Cyanobacteriota bacterium]|nr:hypothetical protein [Cyanobacteriota bacterium]
MSPSRGIPTSRAYWELKAEQVLNRVFEAAPGLASDGAINGAIDSERAIEADRAIEAEPAIEVEVLERPAQPPAAPAAPAAAATTGTGWPAPKASLVLAGIGITALIGAGSSLLLIGLWNQGQQALRQERNLLLLERLRQLGPVAAASSAADTADTGAGTTTAELPPPPAEAWMQDLASLPGNGAPTAEPLQVPLAGRINAAPPAAIGGSSSGSSSGGSSIGGPGGSAPQLVGVVQVSGRSGSAIFQLGGSSTSAGVGESIGSSGWRLLSTNGDSAVIERGGEQRRLSIGSGF